MTWGPAKLGVTRGVLGGGGQAPPTRPMPGTCRLFAPLWICAVRYLSPSWENGGKTKALSDCVYFLAAGGLRSPPPATPGPRTEGVPPPHLPLNPEQGAAWEGADVNSPFSAWMEMLIKSRVIKHLEAREPGRAGRHDALQLPLAAP